jgi:ACS family hexuronate transporter-like MFS transporter
MIRVPHLRWWMATLLFLATVVNYLDRQTLSLLAPMLRDEFGISNTGYSRIIFAFLLAYMIMQSGSGRLMDRLGTRLGFSLAMAFWSCAAMLHALANSAWSLAAFRFLLGAGEAGNWPGSVKAVSEWFPPKERGVAIGYFNSGSIAGALLAPLVVPWIALHYGWRPAFVVTGAVGFLWLVPWLWVYRPPERHCWITARELQAIRAGSGESVAMPAAPRWRDLLRYPQVWCLVAARMLADPVWWFYVFWLPEYLKRERGFSMQMIGELAWIPFLTGGVGSFAGGLASGRLMRRGWQGVGARQAVMALAAAGMLAGIPAVLVRSSSGCIALISVVTFAYCAWASNILALPTDLFPNEVVASVSGIAGTGAAIGGMAFTLATGIAVDRLSYVPVFAAAGLMPAAAATVLILGIRSPRRSGGPAAEDTDPRILFH